MTKLILVVFALILLFCVAFCQQAEAPRFFRLCTYTTPTCTFNGVPSCYVIKNGACVVLPNGDSTQIFSVDGVVTQLYHYFSNDCSAFGNFLVITNSQMNTCYQHSGQSGGHSGGPHGGPHGLDDSDFNGGSFTTGAEGPNDSPDDFSSDSSGGPHDSDFNGGSFTTGGSPDASPDVSGGVSHTSSSGVSHTSSSGVSHTSSSGVSHTSSGTSHTSGFTTGGFTTGRPGRYYGARSGSRQGPGGSGGGHGPGGHGHGGPPPRYYYQILPMGDIRQA